MKQYKETEYFIYEDKDEEILGELIVKVLHKNGYKTGSTAVVGIRLAQIQAKCKDHSDYILIKDPEGTIHRFCKNCAFDIPKGVNIPVPKSCIKKEPGLFITLINKLFHKEASHV